MSLLIHAQEAPASRSKRTVDESKTTCLLYLYADHLYYKRFKSVEAVVAQVTSFISVSLHDILFVIHNLRMSFLNHDFISS